MSIEVFSQALKLLEDVTPLKSDCGLLCSRSCCSHDPEIGGDVWLFPCECNNEYSWASNHDVQLPVTRERTKAIQCNELCVRSARPFLCRIFPLAPFYSKKRNEWSVRMDRRALMVCPLCEYGTKGLSPNFVQAAKSAVQLMATDPECERFLRIISKEESAYREVGSELGLV